MVLYKVSWRAPEWHGECCIYRMPPMSSSTRKTQLKPECGFNGSATMPWAMAAIEQGARMRIVHGGVVGGGHSIARFGRFSCAQIMADDAPTSSSRLQTTAGAPWAGWARCSGSIVSYRIVRGRVSAADAHLSPSHLQCASPAAVDGAQASPPHLVVFLPRGDTLALPTPFARIRRARQTFSPP